MSEQTVSTEPIPSPASIQMLRNGLVGERIIVRLWQPGDADALWIAMDRSRQHLKAWMDWVDRNQSVADARDYISRVEINATSREDFGLGVFHRETGAVLGSTGFHRIDWTVPSLEIGYWLEVESVGFGYMTEAVQLLTDFGFEHFGAERLMICCDPENEPSAAVARRCGYLLEGTLRHDSRKPSGELRDTFVFSRLPGDV